MAISKELIEKAMKAKSVDDIMEIVKKEGIDLGDIKDLISNLDDADELKEKAMDALKDGLFGGDDDGKSDASDAVKNLASGLIGKALGKK